MIAVDIQFTEPTTTERQDDALIESVQGARGVVLSTTETNGHGKSRIFGGEEVVHEIGARAGNTSSSRSNPGGRPARCSTTTKASSSFGVAAAEAATGEGSPADDGRRRQAWIDYRGPPGTFANYPSRGCCAARSRPRPSAARPCDRRLRALAAGRPPDLDHRRRTDVGSRTPGQRYLDRRARLSRSPPRRRCRLLLILL